MKVDEAEHAETALRLGAHELPAPAKGDEARRAGHDRARLSALDSAESGALRAASLASVRLDEFDLGTISAVLPSMIEAEQYFSADRYAGALDRLALEVATSDR